MKARPRLVCARCLRLEDGPPLTAGWHALWRHGWRGFVDVLLDRNAKTDPAAFVAGLLAAGMVLAVLAYAVLGSVLQSAGELLFNR